MFVSILNEQLLCRTQSEFAKANKQSEPRFRHQSDLLASIQGLFRLQPKIGFSLHGMAKSSVAKAGFRLARRNAATLVHKTVFEL